MQEESLSLSVEKFRKSAYTGNVRNDGAVSGQNKQVTPLLANSKPPLLPTPANKPNQSTVNNGFKGGRYIPTDVRAEKIAKGLCYYCDKTYERGHKCKFREPQLLTVEVPGLCEEESCIEEFKQEDVVEPIISMNALSGCQTFQTFKL